MVFPGASALYLGEIGSSSLRKKPSLLRRDLIKLLGAHGWRMCTNYLLRMCRQRALASKYSNHRLKTTATTRVGVRTSTGTRTH